MDANPKEIELPQGQYKVTVTGKVTDEAKASLSGSTSVDLYAHTPVTVNLQKIMQSTLIFKTIHNAGSKQYYMHESYFEIVNNSDEVQYLDNLILTLLPGTNKRQMHGRPMATKTFTPADRVPWWHSPETGRLSPPTG